MRLMVLSQDLNDFWPYEGQWSALGELVARAEKDISPDVVDALLGVFERFSGGAEGRGVFVRISQLVENFGEHEEHLHESLERKPSTWVVRMVQRTIMAASGKGRRTWLARLKTAMQHPKLTTAVRDDVSEILDDHGEEAPTMNMPTGGAVGNVDPSRLIGKHVDDEMASEFFATLGTCEKQYQDACYVLSFPADGVAVVASYEHEVTDVSCFVRNRAYARYDGVLPLKIESGQTKKTVVDIVGRAPDYETDSHMTWYDGERRVGVDYTASGGISLVHVGRKMDG